MRSTCKKNLLVFTGLLLTSWVCQADINLYNEDGTFNPLKHFSAPQNNSSTKSSSSAKPYLAPRPGMKPWDYWGLTENEWNQYQYLLKNATWSVWEHTSSPLTILAITATSQAERKRYARLEAEIDNWRFQSTMDYQVLVNEERMALAREFEQRSPLAKNLTRSDKVLFFTRTGDCDARCRTLINPLLESGAKIDIFVSGTQRQDQVFAWATAAGISPERVQKKEITLNFDNGMIEKLTNMPLALIDLPTAYWRRNSGYEKVIF
jgi:integrating conjugative element protein (TIGR03759 family)